MYKNLHTRISCRIWCNASHQVEIPHLTPYPKNSSNTSKQSIGNNLNIICVFDHLFVFDHHVFKGFLDLQIFIAAVESLLQKNMSFRLFHKCLSLSLRELSVFRVILVRIFPHWDRIRRDTSIQSECGKTWTRITPNTDTFYAVCFFLFL